MQATMTLETPSDVLTYALTLEHLEHAFYREGLETFGPEAFAAKGYAPNVRDYVAMIRDQEMAHVAVIAQIAADLGVEPVAEGRYDFGYRDLEGFLEVARELETMGVSAYQGAARSLIGEQALLTALLTIHGVEARHAAYLSGLGGDSPFPEAFNPSLSPEEALEIVGRFLVTE